jgi:ubiquinone/menaquinone biosynthesis C-methylase UbiE
MSAVPALSQRNPHARQMADESMLRNLAAQASAIWPQEQRLLARYDLPRDARIVDVGCGSGEISSRLAWHYSRAEVVGVDILDGWVRYAREEHAALAPRLEFVRGDAFDLDFTDGSFDLVVCRHTTQAVPDVEELLRELVRVCKPGGWLHVLSEDYGMLHMQSPGADRLWHDGVIVYGASTATDARVGRRTWSLLQRLDMVDLAVDYVVVDTLRVPRETFAGILRAWRDGYTDAIGAASVLGARGTRRLFDEIIASVANPDHYAVWHVPVVSGRKPPVSNLRCQTPKVPGTKRARR